MLGEIYPIDDLLAYADPGCLHILYTEDLATLLPVFSNAFA